MIVRSLRLHNFRNYENQTVDLPAGLLAFLGENGQGKTNLLEALCVLATTKSPLVERDRELIRWEQKKALLSAEVELDVERSEPRHLEYSWRVTNHAVCKELKAGGVPQSAIAQWLGQLQVVAFFPHDLTLITGEPSERRRFLSIEIGKAIPSHVTDLARYRRALQQRNALLKQYHEAKNQRWRNPSTPSPSPEAIIDWNRQLILYGTQIMSRRAAFLNELNPLCDALHRKLSGLEKSFNVTYVPGFKLSTTLIERVLSTNTTPQEQWNQLLMTALEADNETDHRKATTNSGPHRDDLIFFLDDMDLRRYGSQGQQRLGVLTLKLALAHWVKQATGESPILLLDDALSELDAKRRALVLEEAAHFSQCVITATDDSFLANTPSSTFTISAGEILRNTASPHVHRALPATVS